MSLTCRLILLWCLLPVGTWSQVATFQAYDTSDGLSGNAVQEVVQDSNGLLWVLCDYKLHRFDGEQFLYEPRPQPEDPITQMVLFQDSLLALMGGRTIYLLNTYTGSWSTHSFASVMEGVVFSPSVIRQQELGLLVNDASSNKIHYAGFDGTSSHLYASFPKNTNLSTRYQIDHDGNVFAVNAEALTKYGPDGKVHLTHTLSELGTDLVVCAFELDAQGRPLILLQAREFDRRIYMYDSAQGNWQASPANRFFTTDLINHLFFLNPQVDGGLLLAGIDRHLAYYDAREDTLWNLRPQLLTELPIVNTLRNAFRDQTGSIWVVSQLALLKINLNSATIEHYLVNDEQYCQGLCSTRGIVENASGEVLVNFHDGLVKFSSDQKQSQRLLLETALEGYPAGLAAQGDDLWLANGKLVDGQTGKLTTVPGANPEVYSPGFFSRDRSGRLWRLNQNKLFLLKTTAPEEYVWEEVLELEPSHNYHDPMLHVGHLSGLVWLSQNGKLWQYDPGQPIQKQVAVPGFKEGGFNILTIWEDAERVLWLGTDAGLVRYEPATLEQRVYTTAEGLPNNAVCGMLPEGDSCLWLSTYRGLARFHRPTESFTNFFTADGLSHDEFNRMSFFQASDGRMYFGGLNGVNAFYPAELIQNIRRRADAAKVSLTSLEYVDDGRDTLVRRAYFGENETLYFKHNQQVILLNFLFTDYRNPEAVRYSYRMEGLEELWSAPTPYRFARYNSLPPGSYTFRVSARDSEGQWHAQELAIPILVYPPWWATSWAYLLYALIAAAALYLVYAIMQRRLHLRASLTAEQQRAAQLKELDTFKSRLYTNLIHEFRTPLTVILGMVEQIRKHPQQQLETGTQLIEQNGRNLLGLINQMLDLSKLEDQSLRLQWQQADIVPYLRYLTQSFQTFANKHNLSLQFFARVEELWMDIDAQQLQQVMTNLLSNAVKFTPSGGSIKVQLQQQEANILIKVADTGIGITEKELSLIFDRFYQVDGSSQRVQGGTGIGLAHARELVRLMGGEITAYSTVDAGTTFMVTLPIRREAPLPEQQPLPDVSAVPLAAGSESTGEAAPVTDEDLPQVLIIEDNADVVAYLKTCLAQHYQLDVAFNGRIGVEKALETIPDIIISDVMMPYKDGYQVCAELKEDERTSHIPIILLTARADTESKMTGLRRGADVYLAKPFAQEELMIRLEQLLKRQQRLAAYFGGGEGVPPPEAALDEAIQVEHTFVEKVSAIVAAHYQDEHFALPELCEHLSMSRSQLFRKMKALTNIPPSAFIRTYRLRQARELLQREADLNVSEVAYRVGFKDATHFSRSFLQEFGFSPSEREV